MKTCAGLTLTEVLISLAIVTSASLALIQHETEISLYSQRIHQQQDRFLQSDNASEQFLSQGYSVNPTITFK